MTGVTAWLAVLAWSAAPASAAPGCSRLVLPASFSKSSVEFARGKLDWELLTSYTRTRDAQNISGMMPGVATVSLDADLLTTSFSGTLALSGRNAVRLTVPLHYWKKTGEYFDVQGNKLQGFDPVVDRDESRTELGDIHVEWASLVLAPARGTGWMLEVTPGVSLPTGKVYSNPWEKHMANLPNTHQSFGSGTVDPRLGLQLSHLAKAVAFAADGFFTKALYHGDEGLKSGTRTSFGLEVDSGLGLQGWQFGLRAGYNREETEEWESGMQPMSPDRKDFVATAKATWNAVANHSVFLALDYVDPQADPVMGPTGQLDPFQWKPQYIFQLGVRGRLGLAR